MLEYLSPLAQEKKESIIVIAGMNIFEDTVIKFLHIDGKVDVVLSDTMNGATARVRLEPHQFGSLMYVFCHKEGWTDEMPADIVDDLTEVQAMCEVACPEHNFF